jgi:hypothetical protein
MRAGRQAPSVRAMPLHCAGAQAWAKAERCVRIADSIRSAALS